MNLRDRIYLDHNATTPVAESVLKNLETMAYANPSSVHGSGKKARRQMNEVREYLYGLYGLNESEKSLTFHSGATEGINAFIKGLALQAKEERKNFAFFFMGSDHSCINNQVKFLQLLGFEAIELPIDHNGALNREEALALIEKTNYDQGLLNWTWVNNETGVVSSLEKALEIKQKTGLVVHVDAVQSVGKIKNWRELHPGLDAYTMSGHKFGALKGTGFTFSERSLNFYPILNGGGQQEGLRSGTENTFGVFSLMLALKEVEARYSYESQKEGRDWFEDQLKEALKDKGKIIAEEGERNGGTIYFFFYHLSAQSAAMVFDMAGIDLSNGSACSSGAVIPSRVLLAMGYSEAEAKSALRLSFPWDLTLSRSKEIWDRFQGPLNRLLSDN